MTRCRLVGWFCYRTSDRVHVRTGGKVNSRKRSRDGAILCWRWRSWAGGATPQGICMNTGCSEKCKMSQEDKQPQNVPGKGQDRMAHKGSPVSDNFCFVSFKNKLFHLKIVIYFELHNVLWMRLCLIKDKKKVLLLYQCSLILKFKNYPWFSNNISIFLKKFCLKITFTSDQYIGNISTDSKL
jgi:hypothetical protein